MKKFTVGVIGAGRIGQLHIANLIQLNNVYVKTVADPKINEIMDWFESSGVEKYTENAEDIINDSEIDVVFICSSTDTHPYFIEKSINAKKHVFCEKPISMSKKETDNLYEKIKNSNYKVQIGFNRRFDSNFKKIKKSIKDELIGDIHLLKITSRDPEMPPLEFVETSGGLFFDMMIHDFDMARYLVDSEITEVYAQGAALIDPRIEKYNDIDTAIVTLKFKNGAYGIIDNSRQAVYGYDQRAEIFGSKGQVNFENETDTQVKVYTEDSVTEDKPLYFFLERYNDAFTEEITKFFESIKNNEEVSPSYKDGMKAQNLAFAAQESFMKGKPVKVKK